MDLNKLLNYWKNKKKIVITVNIKENYTCEIYTQQDF